MDIFGQNKLLIRMIAILILLNAGLIGFFLFRDKRHKPPPRADNIEQLSYILEKELELTPLQSRQFLDLRHTYFSKENEVLELLRSQRDSMNTEMFNKHTNEILLNQLAQRISQNEYRMEMLRIEQANELKKICTPEQVERFGNLVREIRDYFRPMHPPHGPPPPGPPTRP
jgi:hypothetical protein